MQPVPGPSPSPDTRNRRTAPARILSHRSRSAAPLSAGGAELLRIIADPATPVFLTVHAGGRRRYCYWQPLDDRSGRGSCYVALPTDECDALHRAGRIALGDPVVDPARTIYRVRAADTRAGTTRAARREARTA
ncbi:hypothetical protein AB0K93_16775 [Streptomyces sp. NPDC052676]|uniref:hypothetical protein n=1 Tax=Streptomyces sp. NPDC052676 TaxID=3154953 RepID=UPI003446BD8E